MRKFVPLFLLLLLCFPAVSAAHPGRTDADGGHYDRSTGEYHYHHGYPAHQHTDGICPYDYDDQTGSNSGSSSGDNTGYIPSAVVDSSYSDGYDDGYIHGYNDGYDNGSDDGYEQATVQKDEEYFPLLVASILIPTVLGIIGILRTRRKSSVLKDSLQQENNKLQADFDSLKNQKEKQQQTALSIQEQNKYMKNHIRSLQEDIHSLQIEKQHLQDDANSLQMENLSLKEQVDSFQDDFEIAVDQKIQEKIVSLRNRPQYSSIPVFKDFSSLPIEADNMRFIKAIKESMRIQNFQASATITTKNKNTYHTTLETCDCPDFQNRHHTCKHMYRLAMELGLLIGAPTEEISDKILELNSQMENIKAEQRHLEKQKDELLKMKK